MADERGNLTNPTGGARFNWPGAGGHPNGTRPEPDIDPTSIEGRLRLQLPGHTYFRAGPAVPQTVLDQIPDGARLVAQVDGAPIDVPTRLQAVWSTRQGVWHVLVDEAPAGGYHLAVEGPRTELARNRITADDVINILTVVGAIADRPVPDPD